MAHLARITIYPIKSLDGYGRTSIEVLTSGALADDRRWALVTTSGEWLECQAARRCCRRYVSTGLGMPVEVVL